jgi:hypothetical protein
MLDQETALTASASIHFTSTLSGAIKRASRAMGRLGVTLLL